MMKFLGFFERFIIDMLAQISGVLNDFSEPVGVAKASPLVDGTAISREKWSEVEQKPVVIEPTIVRVFFI